MWMWKRVKPAERSSKRRAANNEARYLPVAGFFVTMLGMSIFDKATIQQRRKRAAQSLDQSMADGDLVLVFCGEPVQKPGGLDQTYPFLPHPEYFWLTGSRRAFGVIAYSKDGGWTEFVNPISKAEMLWEGSSGRLEGLDIAELASWLEKQKPARLFPLGQPSSAWLAYEGVADAGPLARLQESLNRARRIKDAAEAQLVRELAAIANAGYQRLQHYIKPGVTERQIQIEYETEVLKAGSEKFPYDTIVGTGRNAAVLHAIPTTRVVQNGDLVLIDAGADIQDYCVDITRVFPANGSFSEQQKSIYELVAKAQKASILAAKPGVEWHDVHRVAARTMAEGLKSLKLMKGDTEELLESGAISVFFPHGVGHMVGQRVRDVGGDATKPLRSCCGVRVRVDLPLEENFMMTVEPGLYFVPAILDDSGYRSRYKDQVNWSEVEKWRDFGGVRIEDDILIQRGGADVLTSVVAK